MVRQVRVYFENPKNKKTLNVNEAGLVNMRFERLLGNTSNHGSNLLTSLEIIIFDRLGGNQVLSFIQEADNKINLRYGFEGTIESMSPVYILEPIRYKVVYENLGSMITIKAVARQQSLSNQSYLFKQGASINEIVRQLAKRNNWYIGGPNDKTYVNVSEYAKLPDVLYKTAQEDDFTFIQNTLAPIAQRTVYVTSDVIPNSLWDCRLIREGGRDTLYFRPHERNTTRRVWSYHYGVTDYSEVISITNDIDYSFLLEGLTVRIPVLRSEMYIDPDKTKKALENKMTSSDMKKKVKDIFTNYDTLSGVVTTFMNNLRYNIELVPSENIGDLTEDQYIIKAIEDAIASVSKINMEVIGNPDILSTDLIELTVMTREGIPNILSSTGNLMWKVIGITEEIGLSGYKTHLTLVRERLTKSQRTIISSQEKPPVSSGSAPRYIVDSIESVIW